jgi:SMC interacting uncharacterized protein involved in chromosome segregation
MSKVDKLKDELAGFEESINLFKETLEDLRYEIVETKLSLEYAKNKRKELIKMLKELEK